MIIYILYYDKEMFTIFIFLWLIIYSIKKSNYLIRESGSDSFVFSIIQYLINTISHHSNINITLY